MEIKRKWKLIENKVMGSILLNEQEKLNVMEALDYTIGTYLIEDKYPISKGNLTENEFAVYKKILSELNGDIKTHVKNDKEYLEVVKTIMNLNPDKEVKIHMVKMDLAHQDKNWEGVNKHLDEILRLLNDKS